MKNLNATCIHDMIPTLFINEVLENVGGHEAHYFTDRLFGYHKVHITEEHHMNTIFLMDWGSLSYKVIPIGMKNALALFQKIVVVAFKEFMLKLLEVYLDD